MCGIAGMLSLDGARPADSEMLARMVDYIAHRGPDDKGVYIQGPVGLGHRRLSILDIEGGHQPWLDQGRGRALVYNGEVYNYRELRSKLQSRGMSFRSNCDTEVLLQMAEPGEDDWLNSLNGMFAFALWDERLQELYLARDRLGIKPLYYTLHDGRFYFASEIKVLLAVGLPRLVNEKAVPEFLAFRTVSGSETIVRGIWALPPGHVLRIRPGDAAPRIDKFWDDVANDGSAWADKTLNYEEQFHQLIESAIRYRLIADVPVGTYNSGGVDSSLITAKVRQQMDGELHTFSVGFMEDEHDESQYAQVVADRLGTHHHTLVMSGREYADALEETVWYCDQPINHAHTVQLLQLSRLAKQYVTVVLTGEGADELFAGYPRYQIPMLAARLAVLPGPLHSGLGRLLELLHMRRLVKLFEVSSDLDRSILEGARFCSLSELSSAGITDFIPEARRELYRVTRSKGLSRLEQVLSFDRGTYLPALLDRLDRTTMASGVEARVPFLDYRLVEWSMRIPEAFKMKIGRDNKILVKKLAARIFPREMIYRRKVGFGVPVGKWFRDKDGLGRYLDLVTDDTFAARNYCDASRVRKLVERHRNGVSDHSDVLWGLVSLELWQRTFIDRVMDSPGKSMS
ncbi:MAG: asparagine synthase (glutamine-hydrolyzing) [Pseudomonadota bacterium]